MKIKLLTSFLLLIPSLYYPQVNRNLSISNSENQIVITVDPETHNLYGLAYPLTYEISIPTGSNDLFAFRKHSVLEEWEKIIEKNSEDFFNAIEAVRFDYQNNIAYLSVSFGSGTDSLLINFTDNINNSVEINFQKISQYYDNRDAAVICSADDWHISFSNYFIESLTKFREYNLWVTAGIVTDTGWCNETTWQQIQQQLDLGFIEAASHSRNHLFAPYQNTDYEVSGSKQDIINNLDLPPLFRKNGNEYVYLWIAPYGQYTNLIDHYVGLNKYLTSRLTFENFFAITDWQEDKNKFAPMGVAYEMGEATWGGVHDLLTLNNTFDDVIADGEIYHLMIHPHVLNQYGSWQKAYTTGHLQHISNRKNIWYAAVGHLYLYNLLQAGTPLSINEDRNNISRFILEQNYPNPFNPATTIKYYVPMNEKKSSHIFIRIYDVLGNNVATLVNEEKTAGEHFIEFDAGNLSSGIYFYSLTAPTYSSIKKMILIK